MTVFFDNDLDLFGDRFILGNYCSFFASSVIKYKINKK